MILEIIITTIFIATVFNVLLNKINMPTIIGYILTWTIITYLFWIREVASNHNLQEIAEFWIVFLMFTIWLEFSFKNLIKMKKDVFLLGFLQVLITTLVFYFISNFLFSIDVKTSILIALWLSLSSTAIVLKMLNESRDINYKFWNRSLGILIFQDLMVIPILILITIFSDKSTNIWILLGETAIWAIILLIIMYFIWKYLLNNFLFNVVKTKSNEIFILSIIFLVIWASLLAHKLWFSYSLWALIAWILISETHYKHQIEADLIPFRDILLWFFFITVWMQLNIEIIYNNFFTILLLLIILLVLKLGLNYLALLKFWTNRSVFKTALSIFQFGEFGIVIFSLAWTNNIIDPNISQILTLVIILSMIITPFVINNLDEITDLIFRKKENTNWCLLSKNMENHVIIIWYWRLWKILVQRLEKQNIEYIIIESYIKAFKQWLKDERPIIFGSAYKVNTLKSVNIENANSILISVWKSKRLFLIADTINKININWKVIVKVNSYEEKEMLKNIWIKNIIVETEKTAKAMIKKIDLLEK